MLLGFGEWKADKASPHRLDGIGLEENQEDGTGEGLRGGLLRFLFDFCLSTSIPVLTTSTCVVAWPQGDQFLGGGM